MTDDRSEHPHPITRDSEVCEVIEPVIDKFVVDFANSIDVVRGHVAVQRERGGFGARLYDGITGQGAQRQADINARLGDAVEGAFEWLTDLTRDLAHTNRVVAQHSLALARLNEAVTRMASLVATRQELADLRWELKHELERLGAWVAKVEAKTDAKAHMDLVFSKWKANQYQRLPILARCYVAFEELRWGAFGYFCEAHPGDRNVLLATLQNEAMSQMRIDAGLDTPQDRVDTEVWISEIKKQWPDGAGALAYLGEDHDLGANPLVALVTRDRRGNKVPGRSNACRLARMLAKEMFST